MQRPGRAIDVRRKYLANLGVVQPAASSPPSSGSSLDHATPPTLTTLNGQDTTNWWQRALVRLPRGDSFDASGDSSSHGDGGRLVGARAHHTSPAPPFTVLLGLLTVLSSPCFHRGSETCDSTIWWKFATCLCTRNTRDVCERSTGTARRSCGIWRHGTRSSLPRKGSTGPRSVPWHCEGLGDSPCLSGLTLSSFCLAFANAAFFCLAFGGTRCTRIHPSLHVMGGCRW